MRVGVFGGSFDPVHYGHLLLAESCREQCRLDQVWFMPAAVPPHKRDRDLTPTAQRVGMLQLAVAGNDDFHVATMEIDRGGVSYTVDTLAELQRQEPESQWFLLMGADSLQDLATWREPERICRLAIPVAVRRAGSPEPDLTMLADAVDAERMRIIQAHQVEMPVIGLSSSNIRDRVA
ncbi:MAG: nicotinate-nucleotide adenylyltransferase, partial [Pirellulaceae bacterium]